MYDSSRISWQLYVKVRAPVLAIVILCSKVICWSRQTGTSEHKQTNYKQQDGRYEIHYFPTPERKLIFFHMIIPIIDTGTDKYAQILNLWHLWHKADHETQGDIE